MIHQYVGSRLGYGVYPGPVFPALPQGWSSVSFHVGREFGSRTTCRSSIWTGPRSMTYHSQVETVFAGVMDSGVTVLKSGVYAPWFGPTAVSSIVVLVPDPTGGFRRYRVNSSGISTGARRPNG